MLYILTIILFIIACIKLFKKKKIVHKSYEEIKYGHKKTN